MLRARIHRMIDMCKLSLDLTESSSPGFFASTQRNQRQTCLTLALKTTGPVQACKEASTTTESKRLPQISEANTPLARDSQPNEPQTNPGLGSDAR